MTVTKDIVYIGVNDHEIDLFEGQYTVKNGMSYNSYAIIDQKVAIMDTVDARFTHEWLDNIEAALGGRSADYLVIQHMEPDHSANILNFMKFNPNATVVSTAKAFNMMNQFFGTDFADRRIVVSEGDTLSLGEHTLTFVTAPMVHWPEVMFGDVTGDGKVDTNDLLRLAKYLADWDVEIDEDAADVAANGKVDTNDLLRLAKYLADWDVELGK